jgi:hypothetical protein
MDQTYLRRHYCAPVAASAPESHYSETPKAVAETVWADSCSSHAELWAVTEAHDPRTEPIYWLGNPPGAECQKTTASDLDFVGVVGERIPRTAFQAAVVITEK